MSQSKLTPLEAFTQLYENWPMQPSHREHAWLTLKAAITRRTMKKSKTITTILEVQETHSGRIFNNQNERHWFTIRNDNDPELVGLVAVSGLPCTADMMPLGSTYTCTLKINHV